MKTIVSKHSETYLGRHQNGYLGIKKSNKSAHSGFIYSYPGEEEEEEEEKEEQEKHEFSHMISFMDTAGWILENMQAVINPSWSHPGSQSCTSQLPLNLNRTVEGVCVCVCVCLHGLLPSSLSDIISAVRGMRWRAYLCLSDMDPSFCRY